MSGYSGRNRPATGGGPRGVKVSYASQLKEREPLFHTYEHLQGLERGDAALTMLRKLASMVKPIMRKRNWKVQILAEFLPAEQNLLGLNINRGHKICIRLRYHNNPDLFLPMEQVLDTMLHELSHNVWGAHDANFHHLWDELRDEQETLIRKGYTGEGFMTEGKRLGGGGPVPPPSEMRRLARASAEKRQAQNKLTKGSGQRLGGKPLHLSGGDVRNVIADQITRRNTINKGCGSGRADAVRISDEASNNTFKTKAEEDDANNRAINQALFDLIEEEEERKLKGTFSAAPTDGGLAWDPTTGLYDPSSERPPQRDSDHQHELSEAEQMEWALRESASGTPVQSNESNLFEESRSREVDSAVSEVPPPVPLDSKPNPISAPASHTTSQHSTASPTSLPAITNGTIKRKRVPTSPSSPSTSTPLPPAATQAPPLTHPTTSEAPLIDLSDPFHPTSLPPNDPHHWPCPLCTCINPLQFLACDACGKERPQNIGRKDKEQARSLPAGRPAVKDRMAAVPLPVRPQSLGWICGRDGTFMTHEWWTCSVCGKMKESS